MKRLFACLFVLVFASLSLKATIRRVGFTDVLPVTGTDFTTFYAAHQAAVAGDTIYVWPGKVLASADWPTGLDRPEISKRLTIISKGFWLDSTTTPKGNFGLQANPGTAIMGTDQMTFLPASAGSVISGFDFEGNYVIISADNITIKRNWNVVVNLPNVSASNLIVEGNYRLWFEGTNNVANVWTNIVVRNNFIYHLINMPLKSYFGTFSNNTFAWNATLSTAINGGTSSMSYNLGLNNDIQLQNGTWLFENNLLVTLTNSIGTSNAGYDIFGHSNTTFNNNVAVQSASFSTWFSTNGTGNVVLTPAQVPDIFEAFPAIGTSSADGRYRLKAGSPALAGSSARPSATVDAGMYGGPTSYKLGMIPGIPSIYNISSPQGSSPTGNTLQINLSIRSNN